MNKLIFALATLVSLDVSASQYIEYMKKMEHKVDNLRCVDHPIFCQIKKNNPKLDKSYAVQVSNIIYAMTKKYNLRPHIYTAILAQESMYNLGAKNCTTGVKTLPNGHNAKTETTICVDFGISQINYKTAKAYGFDLDRLVSDLHYSIEAGAIVLSDMKKMYHANEDDYWTRYNSSKKTFREEYRRLVERFM